MTTVLEKLIDNNQKCKCSDPDIHYGQDRATMTGRCLFWRDNGRCVYSRDCDKKVEENN